MIEKPSEKYHQVRRVLLTVILSLIVLVVLETIATVGFFRIASAGLKAGASAPPDSLLSSTDGWDERLPVAAGSNRSQPVKAIYRSEVPWKTATKTSSH